VTAFILLASPCHHGSARSFLKEFQRGTSHMPIKTLLKTWQDWEILSIEGTLLLRELQNARQTFDYFKEKSGAKVALDLSKTKLIDSSAVTLLIGFQKRLIAEGGRLAILNPSPEITSVFDVLELEHSIPVFKLRADFEKAISEGTF
jgi:anti-anti-sigma factor